MSGMKIRRGEWEDLYFLPWEKAPGDMRSAPNPETQSTTDKPLLYLPDGTALVKPRPRFGFGPPGEKR